MERGSGRARLTVLISALIAVSAPASAGAATPIGSNFSPPHSCGGPSTYIQTVSPGASYAAPSSGVITSWTFLASSSAGQSPIKFKVARPSPADTLEIVGESVSRTPSPNVLSTYPVSIPVQAGDVIGLAILGPNADCHQDAVPGYVMRGTSGDVSPGPPRFFEAFFNSRMNVSAVLEPDCDGDGLGDETQDDDLAPCDASPPDTTITTGPKAKTKKKTATFTFQGTDARVVTGFECSLDGGAFAPCTSPHTVKVKKGKHTFSVRAVDANGNRDGSVATYDWKVKKRKK